MDKGQRVALRMPRGASRGDRALQRSLLRVQHLRRDGGEHIGREGRKLPRAAVRFVFFNQGIERLAAGLYAVQRGGVGVQLPAEPRDLLRLLLIDRRSLYFRYLGCLTQLLQHVALFGLVGVQLQTERADADGVETLFHHLKRRHLLRDKQHRAALRKRVGDQRGDGLGFAGAGRAVEDKALAA